MAVKGNLSEIGLTDLIQLNCQSGMSGRLTVTSRGRIAQVFFENGVVVHATLGDKSGQEAFYEVLGWDAGSFTLERNVPTPTQTIRTTCSDLLLGGLHQLDEKGSTVQPTHGQQPLPEDLGALFGLEKSTLPTAGDLNTEDDMAQKMQEILADLSGEAPGLFATAVVGMDGLPVAEYARKGVSVDEISAQMTLMIKLVETTMSKMEFGILEDYLLTTENAYLLIRFLDDSGYFLGIGAEKSKTNLGKMRLYSRVYAKRLAEALPR